MTPSDAVPVQLDFDLHGLVGIRLLDATESDARSVSAQLGPIRAHLDRDPDIVVRFVDRLRTGHVRLLGLDDAGFTDDAFLVLRSKYKAPARVKIPLDAIGARPEIVCERGLPAIPLLVPIVNLTALANGALPLHASAFVHRGTGVVATGWSKGGKTEALLAFSANGARYVGDEWVYVAADGSRVSGIPEPVRVWDWHLHDLPAVRSRIGKGKRARLAAVRAVHSMGKRLTEGRRGAAARTYRRALPVLERQLHVDVRPSELFGKGQAAADAPFDRLVFVESHDDESILVRPIEPDEIARRMEFSLAYERLDFMGYYHKFRFAFPDRASPLVENAARIERERLETVLRGKPAFSVSHPYPVSLPALYAAMEPVCR